jgi:hypothetical protein
MTPQEFQAAIPKLLSWIRETLASTAGQARSVAAAGFSRLPLYYSQEVLRSAKFVVVSKIPVPPLSAMGLQDLAEFEKLDFGGITYLDTFFLRQERATDEGLHFHELVHVVQWRLLGPERFLAIYAAGLAAYDYRNSPLEVMAYDAETEFRNSLKPFNMEKRVEEGLNRILSATSNRR